MEWYYADSGQRSGPVSEEEFQALRTAGKIGPDTLVWKAGMTEWQALRLAVPEAAVVPGVLTATGTAHCTQCGRQLPDSDLLIYGNARVCTSCKDQFFQTLREQGSATVVPAARHYGGFWIRFLARFIDGLIVSVVLLPLGFAIGAFFGRSLAQPATGIDPSALAPMMASFALLSGIQLVAVALYEGWFLSKRGATPGKLVLGLKVMRPDGQNVTFARGACRYLAQILSTLILYIGYIMAAFDSEKRTLHDHLCDTRVVYR